MNLNKLRYCHRVVFITMKMPVNFIYFIKLYVAKSFTSTRDGITKCGTCFAFLVFAKVLGVTSPLSPPEMEQNVYTLRPKRNKEFRPYLESWRIHPNSSNLPCMSSL